MQEEDRIAVQRALATHETLRRSWFWGDNGNGQQRSRQASQLNFSTSVEIDGHIYAYTSNVNISRKNFRYKGEFTKDGIRGDVRLFKKLLK